MLEIEREIGAARLVVIGAGGAGNNAVNRMIEAGVKNIEFVGVNTDAQALNKCLAPTKILLGEKLTKGLGAGGRPEVGEKAALETKDTLMDVLKNADMVFITAGMGGGTGTGASPIIAEYAKEVGALTVGVVTRPFAFEGKMKAQKADNAIIKLKEHVDTIIIIENERLLTVAEKSIKFHEAFRMVDEILRQGVEGISSIIDSTAAINVDFNDIRSVMQNAGSAIMGIGRGKGDKAVEMAVESAMKSPLLGKDIKGARGVLFNIVGGKNFGLSDFARISTEISNCASEDGEVFYGVDFSDDLAEDEIIVTVIATGFFEDTPQANASKTVYKPKNIRQEEIPVGGTQQDVPNAPVVKETPTVMPRLSIPVGDIPTWVNNKRN